MRLFDNLKTFFLLQDMNDYLNDFLYLLNKKKQPQKEEMIQTFFVDLFEQITNDSTVSDPLGLYNQYEKGIIDVFKEKVYNSIDKDIESFSIVKESDLTLNPAFKKIIANMPSERYQHCLYEIEKVAQENSEYKNNPESMNRCQKELNILKGARKERSFWNFIIDLITFKYFKENNILNQAQRIINGEKIESTNIIKPTNYSEKENKGEIKRAYFEKYKKIQESEYKNSDLSKKYNKATENHLQAANTNADTSFLREGEEEEFNDELKKIEIKNNKPKTFNQKCDELDGEIQTLMNPTNKITKDNIEDITQKYFDILKDYANMDLDKELFNKANTELEHRDKLNNLFSKIGASKDDVLIYTGTMKRYLREINQGSKEEKNKNLLNMINKKVTGNIINKNLRTKLNSNGLGNNEYSPLLSDNTGNNAETKNKNNEIKKSNF